jgi:hypothetical protein
MFIFVASFGVALFLVIPHALAIVGAGISLSRIEVDKPLKQGQVYKLPPIPVFNPGDEQSSYAMGISYMEGQKDLKPSSTWFLFSPKSFKLQPGKRQVVQTTLVVPVRAEPGKYFALLRAGIALPGKRTGLAAGAAAILRFEVEPGSLLSAVFYWISSHLAPLAPYSYIGLGILGLVAIIFGFRRFLSLSIRLKRPD